MDNPQQPENVLGLSINEEAKQELKTLGVWARIVAIAALISYGISLIVAIIAKTPGSLEFSSAAKIGRIVMTVVIMAIGIPLNIYLLNFARSTLASLHSSDTDKLEDGVHNLRIYFKFLGILLLIALICVGLIVVFAILGSVIGRLGK